jgi:hypothetical protein
VRWSAFLLLPLAIVGAAAASEERGAQQMPALPRALTGEELKSEITGNTLTGRHASGMPYSEYHSPDGRIYGHNNHVPVRDGCWVIRADEVCYTYEKGPAPGVFCWRFFRAPGGYTILLPSTGTVGTAKLETGNPYRHDDGGEPWSCDALLSMNLLPRRALP